MESQVKCPIESQDTVQDVQRNCESNRPVYVVQNINIVQNYYVPSVDTPISTNEDKKSQMDLRQEKKTNIWEWIITFWEWIEEINRAVDFGKNMKEFVHTPYFHAFVTFVKTHFPHFWHK